MKLMNKKLIVIISLTILMTTLGSLQIIAKDELVTLTVRGANIRDVLVMLTEQSGINMVPDETVKGRVTINLKNVRLKEAMKTLSIAYGYKFKKINDNTYLVSKKRLQVPLKIEIEDDKLSLHVVNGDIRAVIKQIAQKADINILMDNSVRGNISVDLEDVPLKVGLMTFLQTNGFSLSKNNDIYKVSKVGGKNQRNNLNVSIIDNKVSIDVEQADLAQVLRTISRLSGQEMILFGGIRDRVDLKLDQVSIEEAVKMILSGTRFTYRKVDDVYLIGDKNVNSPAASLFITNEAISLQYLEAEKVPSLLPNNFSAANIKVLKEQNAILVTGTQDDIDKLKDYIAKIDKKIPQIVIEALIIDISHTKGKNNKAKLGIDYNKDTAFLDSATGFINYKSMLKLPEDFYLNLQSLVEQGQVTVKARPNITTLNGQEARINVDTVQYYQVVNKDVDADTESVDYQSVNTGVSLKVTPWVSSSGEITLKLNPSVSNPSTRTTNSGPPNINRREISTTVRVKDGNTIVLGGLIRNEGSNTESKVPILGDIPLIGVLFSSENNDLKQTELVIYITPHVLTKDSKKLEENKEEMLQKVDKQMGEDSN